MSRHCVRCSISTYLIGDVQGCYRELQTLLDTINYHPDRDQLGFVGDLVNRGPDSLDVMRFIMQLKDPLIVLGNHDLYCLMIGYDCVDYRDHSLDDLLAAKECADILEFLRHQPLMLSNKDYVMVHAGVPPQWDLQQAQQHADAVSADLQGANFKNLLTHMFGNTHQWREDLTGIERSRYIINALTRIRFCQQDGSLDLDSKETESPNPETHKPWFDFYKDTTDIYFGHWASLKGNCDHAHVYALDAGCCWGEQLKAIRVEDGEVFLTSSLRGTQ